MMGGGLLRLICTAASALLAACGAPAPPETPPANSQTPVAAPAQPKPPAPPSTAADLPSCPGINPDIRRPPGSNCYGILPAACGADVASGYAGRVADAQIRAAVAAAVGHDQIRWIRPGEPVIQDLRPGRLNMELDEEGRIRKADCY